MFDNSTGLLEQWRVRTRLILIAALALVGARGVPAQAKNIVTDAQPQDALIVLQMGACERRCPVFKLIIFADGTTIYEGRHYVRKAGVVRGTLPLDSLGRILAAAESMHLYDLKHRYVPGGQAADLSASGECLTPASDAPTAILTVAAKGRTNTIVHFRGCSGADAQRLSQFEDRVVAAAKIAKLIR